MGKIKGFRRERPLALAPQGLIGDITKISIGRKFLGE